MATEPGNYIFIIYEDNGPGMYYVPAPMNKPIEILFNERRGHVTVLGELEQKLGKQFYKGETTGGIFTVDDDGVVIAVTLTSDLGNPTLDQFVEACRKAELRITSEVPIRVEDRA
jgi:hypothetical protein